MLLRHVPAARPNKEDGWLRPQLVQLAFRGTILNGPQVGIAHVSLTFQAIVPGRRIGVFKVRHEDVCSRVERVDDHLPFRRPSDLNAPIQQVWRNRGDAPLRFSNVSCLGGKPRQFAQIVLSLALGAFVQQTEPARFELPA